MIRSKDIFFDVRSKEYQNEQKNIVESEVNNHIKLNKCKTKNLKRNAQQKETKN